MGLLSVRRWRIALPALVAAVAAFLPTPAQAAPASDPFFGVVVDGPMLLQFAPVEQEVAIMGKTGIGSIRLPVHWSIAQPYPSWDQVPAAEREKFTDADGMPIDFQQLDRWALATAKHGIDVMPVILRTPWHAAVRPSEEASPVADMQRWRAFLTALTKRYGPKGTLWQANPKVPARPIRTWQIWNEPNITMFWTARPWAPAYVELLKAAYGAVKAVDPGSRIVISGVANESWIALRDLYAAGARPYFDVAAIHPYSGRVAGVVELVRRARRVMAQNGDSSKPLLLTEMGWTSGKGEVTEQYTWETTEAGQARKLVSAMRALWERRDRFKLAGTTWYTWLSLERGERNVFAYAGLRQQSPTGNVSKPAHLAMRKVISSLTAKAAAKKKAKRR